MLEAAAHKYAGERFGHGWLEPRLKTKFVQTTEWSDTAWVFAKVKRYRRCVPWNTFKLRKKTAQKS